MLVCGNTYAMLGETWLAPHFKLIGDRSQHFGLFPCGLVTGSTSGTKNISSSCEAETNSCGSGGCC